MNDNNPQFQWFGWRLGRHGDSVPHSHCLADVGLDAQVMLYAGKQRGMAAYYWAGAVYLGYATAPERAERRMGYPTLAEAQRAAEDWATSG